MTPMREKFLQKRFEEQSIVFSHNGVRDITQVEHHGFKFYLKTPCFYCPLCGTTESRCNCGVENISVPTTPKNSTDSVTDTLKSNHQDGCLGCRFVNHNHTRACKARRSRFDALKEKTNGNQG